MEIKSKVISLKSFSIIIKLTGDLTLLFKYLYEHFSMQSNDELYLVNQEIENVKSILYKGIYNQLLVSDWNEQLSFFDIVYRYIKIPEDFSINPIKINRYYLSLKTATSKIVLYDFFKDAKEREDDFWDSMYSWSLTFSLMAYLKFLEGHKFYLEEYFGLRSDLIDVSRIDVEDHSKQYLSKERVILLFNLKLSSSQIKDLYELTIDSERTTLDIFSLFLNSGGSIDPIKGKIFWKCSNKLIAAMFETFIIKGLLKNSEYASNIEKVTTYNKSGKILVSGDIRTAKSQCLDKGYPKEITSIEKILNKA